MINGDFSETHTDGGADDDFNQRCNGDTNHAARNHGGTARNDSSSAWHMVFQLGWRTSKRALEATARDNSDTQYRGKNGFKDGHVILLDMQTYYLHTNKYDAREGRACMTM